MPKFYGLDVSKWQKKIDWDKVKTDFVFIRCGYANADGTVTEDEFFKANMEGAAAAGIPVGVYVYAYFTDARNAKKAAEKVLEMVKPYRLEMPLVLDYENEKYQFQSKAGNTLIIKSVLETWENAGYYAMWYTYKYFAQNYVDGIQLAKYDFWLAHYTKQTDYTRPYGVWQYSSRGKVDGISCNVDLNIAYKDYPKIIKEAGLNRLGAIDIMFEDLKPEQAEKITAFADSEKIPYSVK